VRDFPDISKSKYYIQSSKAYEQAMQSCHNRDRSAAQLASLDSVDQLHMASDRSGSLLVTTRMLSYIQSGR